MRYLNLPQVENPLSNVTLGAGARVFAPDTYDRAAALLDAFVEAGGTAIDTAPIYGFGNSEQTLGRWFAQSNKRRRVTLITKGCHPTVDPANPLGGKWKARTTPKAIRADLGESLKRLRTDYVDVYLLHRDDPSVPIGELVEALHAEQRRGRIRAYGASNFSIERLAEANAYAAAHGVDGFVISSPQFGLVRQVANPFPGTVGADDRALAWHREHQFPMLAWSALGSGFVAQAARGAPIVAGTGAGMFISPQNYERVRRAHALAERRGVSTVAIALAYTLAQDFPISAVVGSTDSAHLAELLGCADMLLDAEEIRYLNEVE